MPELWLPPEDRLALWEPVGDQVRVIGWRPGPAGVSTLEVADGLTVVVDHANPTTLAEVAVDLVDGRLRDDHVPLLANLLGDDATDTVRRLSGTTAGTRPTQLRGDRGRSEPGGTTTFPRLALAADVGDDAALSAGARAVAWLEAAAGAGDLGLPALDFARRSVELFEEAPPSLGPELADRVAALAARVERAAGGVLGARLRRAADRLTAPDRRARSAAAPRRAASAPKLEADLAFPAVAAMAAAPMPEELRGGRPDVTPIEVDGPHWAGLTAAGHVQVTAGHRAEGSWARVFRRSDRLLLGLSPMRGAADRDQLQATVVVPSTAGHDLVVDVVDDPSTPRRHPIHDDTRQAVAAGRAAARLTRRRDAAADDAWSVTAARWRALGDTQRANLAERHGRRDGRPPRGSARLVDPRPLLADEVP